jgi:hypothetical protein
MPAQFVFTLHARVSLTAESHLADTLTASEKEGSGEKSTVKRSMVNIIMVSESMKMR